MIKWIGEQPANPRVSVLVDVEECTGRQRCHDGAAVRIVDRPGTTVLVVRKVGASRAWCAEFGLLSPQLSHQIISFPTCLVPS